MPSFSPGQDTAQIADRTARTFYGTLAARQADTLIDGSEVVLHRNGTRRARFGAHAAADTAHLTIITRVFAEVTV